MGALGSEQRRLKVSRLKHLKALKPPQSKQSKLMAQIAAVAKRKGLPCTVTLKEVKVCR